MPTVSAIIPTWRRADLVRSVLDNLNSQSRRPEQIIVVDNASNDETREVARSGGAEVIELEQNLGFAGAVNEGITRATGEWLLLINNDVLLRPDCLEVLLSTASEENAAFATGKLLQAGQQLLIDGTWDLVSRGAHAWRCGYNRKDGPIWSAKRRIFAAPMTAALFHHSVFKKVGLLDTRFEAYYEDVDFGIRCALAGLGGIYEPRAIGTHMSKGTLGKQSARIVFLTARNQLFILAKHYPPETIKRFAWPILAGQTLSLLGAAQHGHLIAALQGKWEGLRRWSAFRNNIQQNAAAVEQVFLQSEQQIQNLQREAGFDPYWRLYFSLVRSG